MGLITLIVGHLSIFSVMFISHRGRDRHRLRHLPPLPLRGGACAGRPRRPGALETHRASAPGPACCWAPSPRPAPSSCSCSPTSGHPRVRHRVGHRHPAGVRRDDHALSRAAGPRRPARERARGRPRPRAAGRRRRRSGSSASSRIARSILVERGRAARRSRSGARPAWASTTTCSSFRPRASSPSRGRSASSPRPVAPASPRSPPRPTLDELQRQARGLRAPASVSKVESVLMLVPDRTAREDRDSSGSSPPLVGARCAPPSSPRSSTAVCARPRDAAAPAARALAAAEGRGDKRRRPEVLCHAEGRRACSPSSCRGRRGPRRSEQLQSELSRDFADKLASFQTEPRSPAGRARASCRRSCACATSGRAAAT